MTVREAQTLRAQAREAELQEKARRIEEEKAARERQETWIRTVFIKEEVAFIEARIKEKIVDGHLSHTIRLHDDNGRLLADLVVEELRSNGFQVSDPAREYISAYKGEDAFFAYEISIWWLE